MRPRPLIIPVENQVRELESKLLLACVAAERGFPVVLGSRTELHARIGSLRRGIYLAKSMASGSDRIFDILHKLGHEIVAWVEDALVHYEPEQYYATRLSPFALERITRLFAWGPENAELFERCPAYPGVPIHTTGNPRTDLLRSELRPYFRREADQILERFGSFVLINTNFGSLNHYSPKVDTLRRALDASGTTPVSDFVAGQATHRNALLHHFLQLIPDLAKCFPDQTIVVRPHPVENPETWRAAAETLPNVHVVLEGNVLPWLMACTALIHNGCTTGIEAFIMERPAIAYQPVTSERFDLDFPNFISHRTFAFEELCRTLHRAIQGTLEACNDPDQQRRIKWHVASLTGALASDRIVDILVEAEANRGKQRRHHPLQALSGWLHASARAGSRALRSRMPGSGRTSDYEKHRFPGLSSAELRSRIDRLGLQLGRFRNLQLNRLSKNIFEIVRGPGQSAGGGRGAARG